MESNPTVPEAESAGATSPVATILAAGGAPNVIVEEEAILFKTIKLERDIESVTLF